MTRKTEACSGCNAEYKISYTLDKEYYQPKFCCFCGDQIAEDEFEPEEVDPDGDQPE